MSHKSEMTDSGNCSRDPEADLKALFKRTAPEITSVDVDALRTTADSCSEKQLFRTTRPFFHWRTIMSVRNVVAVSAIACLVLFIFSHTPVDRSAGIAWAEVKDKIEKARTIQFAGTEYPPGEKTNARMVYRVMIRGRYLKRTEVDYKLSKKTRISIVDAKRGKRVIIEPDSKLFTVFKTMVTVDVEIDKEVDLETANKQEAEIERHPEVDFYKGIREMSKTAKELLPERIIDGKNVVGFRSVEKLFQGRFTMTCTFWIDPKTKLLVRLEYSSRNKDFPLANFDGVVSDFIFDEKLDDSLFSFDPPDGYTVEEPKLYRAKEEPID